MKNNQQGISLMIVFLIMTIMLVMVLSLAVILFRKVGILGNLGSTEGAFNASVSGIEKTLYFDRRQASLGSSRGLCSICTICDSNDCQNCQLTSLSANGCDSATCDNCQLQYTSQFDGRLFSVFAKITPGSQPITRSLDIRSKGYYKEASYESEFQETR